MKKGKIKKKIHGISNKVLRKNGKIILKNKRTYLSDKKNLTFKENTVIITYSRS